MSEEHNRLIAEFAAANPNTIVALHNGGPVEMPWLESVAGVLELYLGGQAIGEAAVNVLFGDVNPSGRLAESFPRKLSDNPTCLTYPGEGGRVKYAEGVFVGYRYYESKEMDTLFPFGHGLSYTTFEYSDLALDKPEIDAQGVVTASVTVANTGKTVGKTVVQLYVAPPSGELIRPLRELKGFEKISLQPGESKTVSITLDSRDFAFWNAFKHEWNVEGGEYRIQIGENAHVVALEAALTVKANTPIILEEFTEGTPMNKLAAFPQGKAFIEAHVGYLMSGMVRAGFMPPQMLDAIGYTPGDAVSLDTLEAIVKRSGRADANPLGALFGQAASMLLQFCPAEGKVKFNALLRELNGQA
jgi:beta-glucosidase